ncbi:MAG: sigma-70 family RNA polymerase sigma factor [Clostridia bacterium]|nr:sigma-70 family RNA polymerase sigma factor [Clostridia bacterium]
MNALLKTNINAKKEPAINVEEKNNNSYEIIVAAQKGSSKALEKLVENNQGLIWNIVRRFYDRGYDIEDLFQIGAIGFIKSIKNFNTELNTQLSTYAVPMIIGEIKRFMRDDGLVKVSRRTKELLYKINNIKKQNEILGKDISIEQLARELEVSKEEIIYTLDFELKIDSLDRSCSEDEDTSFIEKIAIDKNEYNEVLNKIEIEKGFEALNDKEKKVVYYRFFKDRKQGEVANILGVTQVQISRIEKKAIEKMRECLCN